MIDPTYPTNMVLLIVSATFFLVRLVYSVVTGAAPGAAVIYAVGEAAVFFLAWVIARELAPDAPYAAFLSAGIALAANFFLGFPAFIPIMGMVVMFRLLTRSPGADIRMGDTIAVLVWALVGAFLWHWSYGLFMAAAFFLEKRQQGGLERHHMAALISAVGALAAWVLRGEFVSTGVPVYLTFLFVTILFAFTWITRQIMSVESVGDYDQELLDPGRVRLAGLWAVGCLAGAWLIIGGVAILALSMVWAVMLGIVLWQAGRFYISIRKS